MKKREINKSIFPLLVYNRVCVIKSLVQDIKTLASWFHNIQFKLILLETNFAVDAVAQAGHSIDIPSQNAMFPLLVSRAANLDLTNTEM